MANANAAVLSVGDQNVPLDGKGNMLVRFRGAKGTFAYLSAVDVLQGTTQPDAVRGKVVLIGTTALGTREVVATPLDTLFTGVEVQATVADNLLQHDPYRRPSHAVAIEAVVALGLSSLRAVRGLAVRTPLGPGLSPTASSASMGHDRLALVERGALRVAPLPLRSAWPPDSRA